MITKRPRSELMKEEEKRRCRAMMRMGKKEKD